MLAADFTASGIIKGITHTDRAFDIEVGCAKYRFFNSRK